MRRVHDEFGDCDDGVVTRGRRCDEVDDIGGNCIGSVSGSGGHDSDRDTCTPSLKVASEMYVDRSQPSVSVARSRRHRAGGVAHDDSDFRVRRGCEWLVDVGSAGGARRLATTPQCPTVTVPHRYLFAGTCIGVDNTVVDGAVTTCAARTSMRSSVRAATASGERVWCGAQWARRSRAQAVAASQCRSVSTAVTAVGAHTRDGQCSVRVTSVRVRRSDVRRCGARSGVRRRLRQQQRRVAAAAATSRRRRERRSCDVRFAAESVAHQHPPGVTLRERSPSCRLPTCVSTLDVWTNQHDQRMRMRDANFDEEMQRSHLDFADV
jgi:hypothetical protein